MGDSTWNIGPAIYHQRWRCAMNEDDIVEIKGLKKSFDNGKITAILYLMGSLSGLIFFSDLVFELMFNRKVFVFI